MLIGVVCGVGIFRKFRVQISVHIDDWLGFNHGYYYKSIMSLSEKNKEIYGKNPISAIFPAFSARKKNFLKIGLGHILSIVNMHLCAKNQKKLIAKMPKKTVFSAYFRHFRPEKYVCKISWKNIKYSLRYSRNTVFPAKIGCSGYF